MLQFNAIFFRGTDKVSFRIIIRDNKRKEKKNDKPNNNNATDHDIKLVIFLIRLKFIKIK